MPEKGAFCNIHVDFVETKDGEQALLVIAVEDIKAVVAKKISFNFFGEDEAETEDASVLEPKKAKA